jgi:hypothetical protein
MSFDYYDTIEPELTEGRQRYPHLGLLKVLVAFLIGYSTEFRAMFHEAATRGGTRTSCGNWRAMWAETSGTAKSGEA